MCGLTTIELCLFVGYVSCSLTTEYYKNLIAQRSAEAQVYELPQSNEEFRAGSESHIINDIGHYDFVIVGAGSSGSVLATRLSEINNISILLLEAGGEEDDFSRIPDMYMDLQFSKMNWGYFSTPQKNCCLGMKNQSCIVPRGKIIGGSSAINALMYFRGNAKDYDNWAKSGNSGWSSKDVLPYFMKSENSQIDGDECYHGKEGVWNVEYAKPVSPLFSNFINGTSELNVSRLDYNGRNQVGASQVQYNTKCGRRQSTGTAFLANARKRKNLNVVTKALVIKILIDPDKKMAQGVEFVTKNQKFRVGATKEIILSGGAINSPQLLMLSGIGPKEHLKKLGIKTIADLPVGKNLRDHPLFPGLLIRTNYTFPNRIMENQTEEYLVGLGPFCKPTGIDGVGFIHTANASEVPTVEYLFGTAGSNVSSASGREFNYNDDLLENFLSKINSTSDIMFYLILLHEKSTGRITLKSSNPIDFPNIDLNMFQKQEDVDVLIQGIEFVLNLTKTEAFRKINAHLVNITICTNFTQYSKQYWECAIRYMTTTMYHPCGTTRMGPNPKTSVVDGTLRVHGFQNLRVVDAGVFPTTLSGHTNGPVVMVAEKIADEIKRDYGYSRDASKSIYQNQSRTLRYVMVVVVLILFV